MTTIQQLDEFSRFALQLVEKEGQEIPLDAIFDRWHQEAFASDDLARIQASANDYDKGERGKSVEEFLADFDSRLKADES